MEGMLGSDQSQSGSMSVHDLITYLVGMGFEMKDCQLAIQNGKLTVDEAVEWLLNKDTTIQPMSSVYIRKPATTPAPVLKLNTETNQPSTTSQPFSPSTVTSSNMSSIRDRTQEQERSFRLKFEEKEMKKAKKEARVEKFRKKMFMIFLLTLTILLKAHEQALNDIKADREKRDLMWPSQSDQTSSEGTTSIGLNAVNRAAQTANQIPPSKVFKATPGLNADDGNQCKMCRLQVKLLDGRRILIETSVNSTLSDVWYKLEVEHQLNREGLSLAQAYPHVEYDSSHDNETLSNLKLVPSASLIIKKNQTIQEKTSSSSFLPTNCDLNVGRSFRSALPTRFNKWGTGYVLQASNEADYKPKPEDEQKEDGGRNRSDDEDKGAKGFRNERDNKVDDASDADSNKIADDNDNADDDVYEDDVNNADDDNDDDDTGREVAENADGDWVRGFQPAFDRVNNYDDDDRVEDWQEDEDDYWNRLRFQAPPPQRPPPANWNQRVRARNLDRDFQGRRRIRGIFDEDLNQRFQEDESHHFWGEGHSLARQIFGMPVLDHLNKDPKQLAAEAAKSRHSRPRRPSQQRPSATNGSASSSSSSSSPSPPALKVVPLLKSQCIQYITKSLSKSVYALPTSLSCLPYDSAECLHLPYLKSLNLSSCDLFNFEGLQSISGLKYLKSLNLSNCYQLSDNIVPTLIALESLEELTLENTSMSDSGISAYCQSKPPNVLLLSLAGCPITDSSLTSFKNIPKLRNLNLRRCQITGTKGIEQIPNLVSLNLSGTKVTADGLASLGGMQFLRSLDLSETSEVSTNKALTLLSEMPLVALDLTNFIYITDESMSSIALMTRLKILSLRNVKITDRGILQLKTLTSLQELHLDRTELTDVGCSIFPHFTQLQQLSLPITSITDTFISSGYLDACRELTKLNLSKTSVTSAGILRLRLPSLILLNINETYAKPELISSLPDCPLLTQVIYKNLKVNGNDYDGEN
ncbi:hypothetical protein HELRODRAFT_188417 [Helobdella robusta]|uniref:UBX domain-containing protein n=1 Tax=Helobdella robusta TaxID=6412 RepID=T1FPZ0_HELRO|nr:hypothetical protein HELRODRAFT_188417 [Helobdella robusta]ESO06605.1 hypothetical protein HELRODRAFT_188417 [Helobdella robusta]